MNGLFLLWFSRRFHENYLRLPAKVALKKVVIQSIKTSPACARHSSLVLRFNIDSTEASFKIKLSLYMHANYPGNSRNR